MRRKPRKEFYLKKRIDIIIPNRIGDVILTLPALLCLRQLEERFPRGRSFRLVSHLPLVPFLDALDLFPSQQLNLSAKLRSWLTPADHAYFLVTTSKNIGYHARTTYGSTIPGKIVRYDRTIPSLTFPGDPVVPEELAGWLAERHQLPPYAIHKFGLCFVLGYDSAAIRSTFSFSETSLSLHNPVTRLPSGLPPHYLAFCMEAAYGSTKRDDDRCWQPSHFLALAEQIYRETGVPSVFVGISSEPPLPATSWCHDLRRRLGLDSLVTVLGAALGYVGNDTGPLHLANVQRRPAAAVYLREGSYDIYRPLFPHFSNPFHFPTGPEELLPVVRRMTAGVGPR